MAAEPAHRPLPVRIARDLLRKWPWLHRLQAHWRAQIRAQWNVRHEHVRCAEFAGARVYYPSASSIGHAIAAGRGWEPTLAEAMEALLPRDEPLMIAEIGSNIGATLAQMISVRPSATYVCFEPAYRFRSLLARTVSENGWGNVRIEDAFVGSNAGAVDLFTNATTASAARRDYGHVVLGVERPRSIRLDDYFESAVRLDFVKTDTDGFDADVLLGARKLLERLKPAIYFELAPFLLADIHRSPAELLEYLADLEYRDYVLYTQSGEPLKLSHDLGEVARLADEHNYLDVLTAARPEQVPHLRELVG